MFAKTFMLLLALAIPPTIQETPIIAEIIQVCNVYDDKDLNTAIGEVFAGAYVEILQDYSAKVYKIYAQSEGLVGWVLACCLKIAPETPTDKSAVHPKQLESFVNSQNFVSKTNFLLLTDINRQKIHVFTVAGATWNHKKSFDCSTGLNISPTTRGTFIISERGPWFYSERLASGAKFWMRFNDQYLIHSIPMDKNQKPLPGENAVGQKLSNGCIRLLLPDAKWLYENIPDGSVIVII